MGLLVLLQRPHLDDLPPIALRDGYRLAAAAEFAEPAPMWAALVNESFGDQRWTADYIHENFASRPQYDAAGVFFVMHGDDAVSTAFAWLDEPGETEEGRIHWVGVREEHRGKGLARAVVVSVMRYFKERGFKRAFLETQPRMTPAICLYMSLGLEPVPRTEEEQKAWDEVFAKVGRERQ